MPFYDYECEKCQSTESRYKSIAEYNTEEYCSACQNPLTKLLNCRVHFVGAKVEDAEYNVGLGAITKSSQHRKELAKRKGLEEIGNESPDKIKKHYAQEREQKRKANWEKV